MGPNKSSHLSVAIVPKAELSKTQMVRIEERRSAAEHEHDTGPIEVWNIYNNDTLYAVIDNNSGKLVGLADASGSLDAVNAGWWIDESVRKKGYGYALVDALAEYLKEQGYTGVGHIRIIVHCEEFRVASRKLEARFRGHFSSGLWDI